MSFATMRRHPLRVKLKLVSNWKNSLCEVLLYRPTPNHAQQHRDLECPVCAMVREARFHHGRLHIRSILGDRKSIEEQNESVGQSILTDARRISGVGGNSGSVTNGNTIFGLREQSFAGFWSGDCRDVSRPLAEAGEGRHEERKSGTLLPI